MSWDSDWKPTDDGFHSRSVMIYLLNKTNKNKNANNYHVSIFGQSLFWFSDTSARNCCWMLQPQSCLLIYDFYWFIFVMQVNIYLIGIFIFWQPCLFSLPVSILFSHYTPERHDNYWICQMLIYFPAVFLNEML